jgi:photosystem II stability/assembly factor-like uncharacterized protein
MRRVDHATLFAAAYGDGGGIFRTVDAATSWSRVLEAPEGDDFVALSAIDDRLYAGTRGGKLYVSGDSGSTWTHVKKLAIPDVGITTAVDNLRGELLVGTTGRGVFRVAPDAGIWVSANAGMPVADVRTLTIASRDGPALLTGKLGKRRSSEHRWRRVGVQQ